MDANTIKGYAANGNWISRMVVGAVANPIASAVQGAGSMAGGAVGGVGNAINGVGRGIEGSIRYYGDGVKDYGNAIQDWTSASGTRQGTASNPLGLAGTPTSGKVAFGAGKTKPQDRKPAQKALPAPARKPATAARAPPAKAPAARPAAAKPSPRAVKPATSTATGTKSAINPATGKVKQSAASKPQRAPRTSAPKSDYGRGSAAATNPLGL